MRGLFLAAALAVSMLTAGAPEGQAQVWGIKSNDSGGIIPWTPETALNYRQIAAAECGRWYKVAYITSVHAVYGDYIGFVCVFPRGYDPAKAWAATHRW
jgi:hypothetical protein